MVDQKEEDKKDRKRKQSQIEKSGRMMNEDSFVYRDDTMKETLTIVMYLVLKSLVTLQCHRCSACSSHLVNSYVFSFMSGKYNQREHKG